MSLCGRAGGWHAGNHVRPFSKRATMCEAVGTCGIGLDSVLGGLVGGACKG